MRISVCDHIKGFDGSDITHPDSKKASFRSVVLECLVDCIPALDTGKEAKHSMDLYYLAKRIADEPVVDLNIEELATIKARINASQYTHLVKGRIFEIIEGQNVRLAKEIH